MSGEFDERQSTVPDPNAFEEGDNDPDARLAFRAAFSETLSQHGFPDTLVLSRERAEDVFDERQLEIIDYLAENEPRSVRALAGELGYDKGVVSRDLQRLARIDVIEYEEDGRAKAPRLKHAHVVVEPVV
ncbi:winged helix-turn-helix transcriptional regulator [Natronomonas sp. EA1]|uniref:HVO_A0114 family putative DNA-binding protein n=1 Tax=Natronomonas sp. EA1 TaxID=3421655 RepID=UPI003EB7992B